MVSPSWNLLTLVDLSLGSLYLCLEANRLVGWGILFLFYLKTSRFSRIPSRSVSILKWSLRFVGSERTERLLVKPGSQGLSLVWHTDSSRPKRSAFTSYPSLTGKPYVCPHWSGYPILARLLLEQLFFFINLLSFACHSWWHLFCNRPFVA